MALSTSRPGRLARSASVAHARGNHDRAELLERQLNAMGRCRRCGRTLTDPESIEAGIGRDCARKADLRVA